MKSIHKVIFVCSLLSSLPTMAIEPFSGVYIHPSEFSDPAVAPEAREAEMDKVLDGVASCGFTTVIPYATTTSGGVYWPGTDAPMAGVKDWDALGIFVKKARARGLKIMPAVCVLAAGHDAPAGILEQHPDWALRDEKGAPLGWISPANGDARAWVTALVLSMVKHVQPDGIMLDYMRFPSEGGVTLDPAGMTAFDAAAPGDENAAARKERLQRAKEAALTSLMTDLGRALRAHDPKLRIGLYTWGANVTSNHAIAQCWPDWLRAGYLDLLNVSGYCYRDNYGEAYLEAFEKRLRDAADLARRESATVELTFALGVKTSHGAVKEESEFAEYLAIARRMGYPGVAAFAWESVAGYADAVTGSGCFRLSEPWRATKPRNVQHRMVIDLGKDRGQHFGSLFQVTDAFGNVLIGAGFQGAYNTYYRSDRFLLQVFTRPADGADALQEKPFERPGDSQGYYLFNAPGGIYAADRTLPEETLRWDTEKARWAAAGPPAFQVAGAVYEIRPNRILDKERTVFSFDPEVGSSSLYYYAAGHLFFHAAMADTPNRQTFIYACPWDPETEAAVSLENAHTIALAAPGEFPYAYGQLHGDVFAATNNGGFYRFRDDNWDVLRPSDPKVSFQIYSMINYYDRLLMGQYPTGELFEITGGELRPLPGWPPRPPQASPGAREAQTLALYRGELFAGVWPWGELWRLPGPKSAWVYAGRLFSQPEIQPDVTAPWEADMTALGETINNLWGQRITSLVPFGDSLLAGTSNKNGAPYEERLQFLSENRHEEYGAIHHLSLPGHLSVPFSWTGELIQIDIFFSEAEMRLLIGGNEVAALPLDKACFSGLNALTLQWGQGIFGPLQGKIVFAGSHTLEENRLIRLLSPLLN